MGDNNNKINKESENEQLYSEKRWNDALTFYKLTLKIISTIILFISIVIGYVSISSKVEIDTAIQKMETQFKELREQNIKEPDIEIKHQGRSLDAQILNLVSNTDTTLSTYTLSNIVLFNNGNGSTVYPSINLFFADSIDYVPDPRLQIWVVTETDDDYYKYGYQIRLDNYDTPDLTVIYPKESDPLMDFNFNITSRINELRCKVVVYTDNIPASATFTLRLR
jgi:hypothetical protein